MPNRVATLRRLLPLAVGLCLAACSAVPSAGTAPAADEEPGRLLYARHCASCHRPFDRTLVAGRTASRIRSSIVQYPIMFQLRHLSDEDLAALEVILAVPGKGKRP